MKHSLLKTLLWGSVLGIWGWGALGCVSRAQTKVIRIDSNARPSGKFMAPLENATILSRFGNRKNSFHTGVDLKNASGKIKAARKGTVSRVGTVRGYGKLIEITHPDGFISRYAHLKKYLVENGTPVKQGDVIAIMGQTGRASTPHLHFEILTPEKRFTDPCQYIQCRR